MPFHVCVYDVGCFVDVLASRSVLCEEAKCSNDHNTSSSSVGFDRILTGVSQVVGLRPTCSVVN